MHLFRDLAHISLMAVKIRIFNGCAIGYLEKVEFGVTREDFLINTGKVAPTQGLLERIAVAISPATRAFTRADLHHLSILTPPAAGQMTLK